MLVGIPISAFFLWVAFKDVDPASVGTAIGNVGGAWIIGSLLFDLLSLAIRAFRWRILLLSIKPLEMPVLLSNIFIGLMLNNVFPARLGEVGRAWLLARREQLSGAGIFGTIVAERLLDILAILVVLGAALGAASGLSSQTAGLIRQSGMVVLIVAFLGTAGLLLLLPRRNAFQSWLGGHLCTSSHPWIRLMGTGGTRFIQGLYCVPSVGSLLTVLALSVLGWIATIACYFAMAMGFGLDLSFSQAALVLVIVMLGIAIPSAPGFIGTFHGFCVAALALVAGTDPALAAAYATLLHGMQWILNTLVGSACLLGDRSVSWPVLFQALARGNRTTA